MEKQMKRRTLPLLLLLLPVLFLPGCASLPFTREQTPEQQRSVQRYDDATIKTEIASALLRKNPAKANNVSVRCFYGHVFLIGEASEAFRSEALDIVRRAQGVTQVTTHWFPAGTTAGSVDVIIESKIGADVLRSDAGRAGRIAVDVWGGHVVLTGAVGHQSQIDTVVAKIRQIDQVKGVTSYISLY